MKTVIPFLLTLVGASALSLHAAPLQYAFKTGNTYTYSVRIEADEPTYKDVLQGNITLKAQAGVMDQAGGRFTHTGVLLPVQLGKDGTPLAAPRPSRLMHLGFGLADDEAWWGVDSSGRVSYPVGAKRATLFAFGSLARLLMEPLSPTAATTWDISDDCLLFIQPLAGSAATATALPAHEHIVYTVGTGAGDVVSVNKHYEFNTVELVGGEPRIRIAGEGHTTFDAKLGMPSGSVFNATLYTRSVAGTEHTPLSVTIHLLKAGPGSETPAAPVLPTPPATVSAGLPVPSVNSHTQPLTNDERISILADLKDPDSAKKLNAANRLAGAAPDDHRTEVAQALRAALEDWDLYVRQAAVRALAVWGGREAIPAVVKLLDDREFSVRWAALDALGDMRAAEAAPVIAKKLTTADSFKAAPALEEIGSPAAIAVVPYLKEKDWATRLEACQILKEIGGPAEMGALEALAGDENPLVRAAAGEAVKAIRAR